MRDSSYYRAQADHARLLADITVQESVAAVLRGAVEQFDHLADRVANSESDFIDTEITEYLGSVPRYFRVSSRHHG
jgi:hypothetical protein